MPGCLFFPSLLFIELLWNFLSSPWPDSCWLFSLLKEKNTPFIHVDKFKTRQLLPPPPLCRLVNQPVLHSIAMNMQEALCRWFSSCLCCVSFFSLYLIHGSEWIPITTSTKTSMYPTTLSPLSHCDAWKTKWIFSYFVYFLNPLPNIFLDFFPSCYCSKI